MLVEFCTARMYTGPCYCKYNAVMRSCSKVLTLVSSWQELCHSNLYTSTIHALNSAIVKLGKLTVAQRSNPARRSNLHLGHARLEPPPPCPAVARTAALDTRRRSSRSRNGDSVRTVCAAVYRGIRGARLPDHGACVVIQDKDVS